MISIVLIINLYYISTFMYEEEFCYSDFDINKISCSSSYECVGKIMKSCSPYFSNKNLIPGNVLQFKDILKNLFYTKIYFRPNIFYYGDIIIINNNFISIYINNSWYPDCELDYSKSIDYYRFFPSDLWIYENDNFYYGNLLKRIKQYYLETNYNFKNELCIGYETKLDDIKEILGIDFLNNIKINSIFDEKIFEDFLNIISFKKYQLILNKYRYKYYYYFYDNFFTYLSLNSFVYDFGEIDSITNNKNSYINNTADKILEFNKLNGIENLEMTNKRQMEYNMIFQFPKDEKISIVYEVFYPNNITIHDSQYSFIKFTGNFSSSIIFYNKDINLIAYSNGGKSIKTECSFFMDELYCKFLSFSSGDFYFKLNIDYISEKGLIIKAFDSKTFNFSEPFKIRLNSNPYPYMNYFSRQIDYSPAFVNKNLLFYSQYIYLSDENNIKNEENYELSLNVGFETYTIYKTVTVNCEYIYIGKYNKEYLKNCEAELPFYNQLNQNDFRFMDGYIKFVNFYYKDINFNDTDYFDYNEFAGINIYNIESLIKIKIENIENKFYFFNNFIEKYYFLKFSASSSSNKELNSQIIVKIILNGDNEIQFNCIVTGKLVYSMICENFEYSYNYIVYTVELKNYFFDKESGIFIYPFLKEVNHFCLNSFLFFYFKGIDVSSYQGSIDWKKVRENGIIYAIIRAGGSNSNGSFSIDSNFENNYKEAKKNNILVGIYWYTHSTSIEFSEKEALYLLDFTKNKSLDINILFYDVEKEKTFLSGNTSFICVSFCNTLALNNHICGIYSSSYYFKKYFDENVLKTYPIWVAQYTQKEKPDIDINWNLWQFSDKGEIEGISENKVDLNYAKMDQLLDLKVSNYYINYSIYNYLKDENFYQIENKEEENKGNSSSFLSSKIMIILILLNEIILLF